MEKCRHSNDACEACTAEIKDLKIVLVRLDSYLSLVRHRYRSVPWPDGFEHEVDEAIGDARRLTHD